MKYKKILNAPHFATWLMDLAQTPPVHSKGVEFPAVFPYEEIESEGMETEYVIYPGSPFSAFDLEEPALKMETINTWYEKFSNEGMPIDEYNTLLQARNQMAKAMKPFGVQINRVETQVRNARYRRDTKLTNLKAIYRGEGMPALAADHKALTNCKEEFDLLTELNELWKNLKSASKSYDETTNAMAGVRSTLQNELRGSEWRK